MKRNKIDPEARALEEALEKGTIRSRLTPARRKEIEAAAARPPRITPRKEERFNIRISGEDLNGLKARAEELGMPYQTLASSVLSQIARGRLVMRVGPGTGKLSVSS